MAWIRSCFKAKKKKKFYQTFLLPYIELVDMTLFLLQIPNSVNLNWRLKGGLVGAP
jgi:hypothetical protein